MQPEGCLLLIPGLPFLPNVLIHFAGRTHHYYYNEMCFRSLYFSFGEIALMYGTQRTASVISKGDGVVWGIERARYRALVEDQVKQDYDSALQLVDSVSIFKDLTSQQKNLISSSLITQTFSKRQVVMRQGDTGDILYLIKSGVAEVWVDNKLVRQLNKGSYFGERALLYDEKRSATIIAAETLVCFKMTRGMLEKVVVDLQTLLFRNIMRVSLRTSNLFSGFIDSQIPDI